MNSLPENWLDWPESWKRRLAKIAREEIRCGADKEAALETAEATCRKAFFIENFAVAGRKRATGPGRRVLMRFPRETVQLARD